MINFREMSKTTKKKNKELPNPQKLLKLLNLDLAWRRVLKDQHNDFIPDFIKYKDFELNLKDSLERIRNSFDNNYTLSDLLDIDVPKQNFVLRTGANQKIGDRIVYEAINLGLLEDLRFLV